LSGACSLPDFTFRLPFRARGSISSVAQIKSALLGLLISGGMLIPGNIPNIIAAHALHIKSTEWARLGVPLGLIIMAATAALLWLGLL